MICRLNRRLTALESREHWGKSEMNRALRRMRPLQLGLALASSSYVALANQSARLVYARAADAASCAEESMLRQSVARRLGYDPFVAVSDNTVVAEMRGEGDGLRARIFVIESGYAVGGARELKAETKNCGELMLAVALAISIAIDPESIDRVVDSSSEPSAELELEPIGTAKLEDQGASEPPPLKAPQGTSRPVVTSATKLPAATTMTWRFGAAGYLATGPAPLAVLGIAGSVELAGRKWSLGLEPRWSVPSESLPQSETGAKAASSMLGVTLTPCYRKGAWRGCYLVELGRLDSKGTAVEVSKRDTSLWTAQGLRLAYHVGGEHGFGLTAKLDGLFAFNRVELLLNSQSVHKTPWFVGRIGIETNYGF